MNYFEARINQCQRRLERIESNTDLGKLRTNKLLYELEKEHCQSTLEAWKANRPFGACTGLEPIFSVMGLEQISYFPIADRSMANATTDYFSVLRKHGYPDNTCDRTVVALGMCLAGHLPWADISASIQFGCSPEMLVLTEIGLAKGRHHFRLDAPLDSNYESVHYFAEQLGELIEYTEATFPGAKYDEDKLIEVLEHDREAIECLGRTYELRKRVPSPMSGQDAFRIPRLPSAFYPHHAKALAYVHAMTEELGERAEKGMGGVPEEKLRVIWVGTGPYTSQVFSVLHGMGVSVPWFHYAGCLDRGGGAGGGFYGDDSEFGRRLTPLEELGRRVVHDTWGGRGLERWVPEITQVCRDLKIDAAVIIRQIGCFVMIGLATITRETLKRELDIPALEIDARQIAWNPDDEQALIKDVEEFVGLCLDQRAKS